MTERKYQNSGRRPLTILFVCTALLCLRQIDSAAAENKKPSPAKTTIVFSLNLPPSLLGKGAADIMNYFIKLQKILDEKEGVELKLLERGKWDDVVADLQSGRADAAWLPPYYYARERIAHPASAVRPLAAYKSGDSMASKTCVYVLSGSDKKKNQRGLDNLYGARISFPDEAGWAVLNLILDKSGIYIEPYIFFRGFHVISRESAALAMVFGSIDAVVMDELSEKIIRKTDKRLEGLEPAACSDPLPNTLIATGKSLDPAKRKIIEKILFSLNRDKNYAVFQDFFKLTGGRWSTVSENYYSPWLEIARQSSRNGWDKSFNTIPGGN